MHLTTIDQCKAGDIVYHPLHGRGRIVEKFTYRVFVVFDNEPLWSHDFINDADSAKFKSTQGVISHLFTEPVYICEKALVPHRNDFGDHEEKEIYLPINPNQ